MRIVAGKLKGRVLKALDKLEIRPTSERVREAIFSTLVSRIEIENKSILDLYAGSGALGIEALSRGAASCVFVEKQKPVVKALNENLENLSLKNVCYVENTNVESFLEKNSAAYDLIFADPPYGTVKEPEFISLLLKARVFKPGSLLLFEDSVETGLESYEKLDILYRKNYGDTLVSLFRYN